jgi:hypothetical protein
MARVSLSSPSAPDVDLLPGEVAETRDMEDTRQWVSIYRQLLSVSERALSRLRRGSSDADERVVETDLHRLRSRLEFWERRLWDLAGLDLDVRRRILTFAGQRVTLTRREAELLAFLARRPGQFYSAAQLVSLAWASPELSPEQLRTYVVRLRRHLAGTGVPARLVSEPRRGYGLVFTA